MTTWNIFKKAKPANQFLFFEVVYNGDMIFGVTAETSQVAEEIVCEDIFHNQTIPGFPVVKELSQEEVKKKYAKVPFKKVKQKGVWYSG